VSDGARTLWIWYVAPGDAHGRYWAVAPAGSTHPEVIADVVHIKVHSRTQRAWDIGRGFLEVEGRLLVVRTVADRIEATIIEPDDRPTLPPPPSAADLAASFPNDPEIPV
jgi:hypothetical protein